MRQVLLTADAHGVTGIKIRVPISRRGEASLILAALLPVLDALNTAFENMQAPRSADAARRTRDRV